MTLSSLPDDAPRWRAVVAASVGNALEWFDFIIYGFFAITIAKLFFPAESEAASLLLTLASLGVPIVVRPFGAIVLGQFADRHGRKTALTLTISIMMAGTAITAFTPTYRSIGIWAPILIIVARLMQGFSAGGEFGSATVFLAEHDPSRRGFFASWQFASQGLSTVLAAGFGAALHGTLTPQQLESWGWRMPFVFGLLIGPVAYYVRRRVDETAEFRSAQTVPAPLRETWAIARMRVLIAIGTTVILTVAAYTAIFMPTYAIRELGLPTAGGFLATLVAGAIQVAIVPVAGALSDRLGRLPIASVAIVAILIVIYPLFAWIVARPTIQSLLLAQATVGVLVAAYAGAIPALLSELFPIQIRTTAVSISYSLAVAIFGGFAPFIMAWLIAVTGSSLAPSFYVMFAAVVSMIALGAAYRLGFR